MHPNQITQWKAQLLDGAADVFGAEKAASANPPVDVKTLHAKIGELTLAVENGSMARASVAASIPMRVSLTDAHK